jgi:hypothetical protein
LALATVLAFASASRVDEPFALKVLCAGNPGSSRETDFKSLLGKCFTKVGTIDYLVVSGDYGIDTLRGRCVKPETSGPKRAEISCPKPTILK